MGESTRKGMERHREIDVDNFVIEWLFVSVEYRRFLH